MRPIKFRAWDKRNNKMIYGLTGMLKIWDENVDDLLNMGLMQYTGLKDKNGKKIFEGDIVKTNYGYLKTGIIEYSPPQFVLFDGKDGVYTDYQWDEWENFEVIGNIYENEEIK